MSSVLWSDIHGGVTHFPIALVWASFLFDLIAWSAGDKKLGGDLRAASFYCIVLGAAASFAAVLSGLVMAGWDTNGRGLLGEHHLFVWPAFGMIVALAVWRIVVGSNARPQAYAVYTAFVLIAAVLMAGAGYWGGRLLGA
jgi:uncharacterized membrane protein